MCVPLPRWSKVGQADRFSGSASCRARDACHPSGKPDDCWELVSLMGPLEELDLGHVKRTSPALDYIVGRAWNSEKQPPMRRIKEKLAVSSCCSFSSVSRLYGGKNDSQLAMTSNESPLETAYSVDAKAHRASTIVP